jgi:hypothetical protein
VCIIHISSHPRATNIDISVIFQTPATNEEIIVVPQGQAPRPGHASNTREGADGPMGAVQAVDLVRREQAEGERLQVCVQSWDGDCTSGGAGVV